MTLCSSALIRPGWPLPTSDSMWVESLVSAWTTHTLKSLSLSRTSGGIASLLRSERPAEGGRLALTRGRAGRSATLDEHAANLLAQQFPAPADAQKYSSCLKRGAGRKDS